MDSSLQPRPVSSLVQSPFLSSLQYAVSSSLLKSPVSKSLQILVSSCIQSSILKSHQISSHDKSPVSYYGYFSRLRSCLVSRLVKSPVTSPFQTQFSSHQVSSSFKSPLYSLIKYLQVFSLDKSTGSNVVMSEVSALQSLQNSSSLFKSSVSTSPWTPVPSWLKTVVSRLIKSPVISLVKLCQNLLLHQITSLVKSPLSLIFQSSIFSSLKACQGSSLVKSPDSILVTSSLKFHQVSILKSCQVSSSLQSRLLSSSLLFL